MGAQARPGVVSAVPGRECGRLVRGTRGALPQRWSQMGPRRSRQRNVQTPGISCGHSIKQSQISGWGRGATSRRSPEIAKATAAYRSIARLVVVPSSQHAGHALRALPKERQRYALCHSDAFASTSCATASASVPDACRAPRTVFIFSTLVSITNREVRLNARPTCLGVAHSSAGTTSP